MTPTPRETDPQINDVVELDITNVAHGGVSVARLNGRVIFVSDTLPGERVRARLTETSKKSFWRADTVEVVDASPFRRDHVWAAAALERDPRDRAGGAEFGHIALDHQRELKRQVLADALQRFGKIDGAIADQVVVEALPNDAARAGLAWRTRISLHVDDNGVAGPYAARSHRVVPVNDLPLAHEDIASLAPADRRFVGAETVDLVAPSGSEPRLIVSPDDAGAPRSIVETVGSREFVLDEGGFWQVHRDAASHLTDAVSAAVDPDLFDISVSHLDLYGGVGLFAAALGDRFGSSVRVTSVESSERATDHASENLSEWLGARAVTGRVDRFLASLQASHRGSRPALAGATVVLDPPRSGAGADVVTRLTALQPTQVVYVACDPVALARDLAFFGQQGYRLTRLRSFDLFPHTHHSEAVATLVRD